jgi:hypothetical protein
MGLEPTTPCLQSRCSSHLSYVPLPATTANSGPEGTPWEEESPTRQGTFPCYARCALAMPAATLATTVSATLGPVVAETARSVEPAPHCHADAARAVLAQMGEVNEVTKGVPPPVGEGTVVVGATVVVVSGQRADDPVRMVRPSTAEERGPGWLPPRIIRRRGTPSGWHLARRPSPTAGCRSSRPSPSRRGSGRRP